MANEEHERKLRQGVEAWNEWREENPGARPDLGKADLSFADLTGADLSGADLRRVGFIGANLNHANLSSANLGGAFFDTKTVLNNVTFSDRGAKSAGVVDVHWDGVNLAVVNWEPVKKLGEEYQAYVSKNQYAYQTAVRANRQLVVVLRDQGLNEEADYFAYRAQLLQRVVWRKQGGLLKYTGSWLLWLLAGYGYRPLRSVLWYLFFIVGFAFAYYTFGHLSLWPPDAFIYSLTSFHGRGFFPGFEGKPSLHDPLIILAAFEAVIGLFIEISFIATFTLRFFGR